MSAFSTFVHIFNLAVAGFCAAGAVSNCLAHRPLLAGLNGALAGLCIGLAVFL